MEYLIGGLAGAVLGFIIRHLLKPIFEVALVSDVSGVVITSSQPIPVVGGLYAIDGTITTAATTAGEANEAAAVLRIYAKIYPSLPSPIPQTPPSDATDHGIVATTTANPSLLDFQITQAPVDNTDAVVIVWVMYPSYGVGRGDVTNP